MVNWKFISSVWILLLALSILWASPLTAEEGGDEEDLLFGESEMVITPARHNLTVSDAPASVTVITEEDIATSGAQTLTDLFREVPGLEVFATSATDVNISARGHNGTLSNKMLVMLDGRSVYEDFFGFTVWEAIPITLHEIKQIEVVRGPGSAVYGANAYSGVIHIITKSPRELAGTTFMAQNSVESERREVSIAHAGRTGKTDYKSFFSWRAAGFLGKQSDDPERENLESYRGSFSVTRPVGDRSDITFHTDILDGKGDMQSGIGKLLYNAQLSYTSLVYKSPGAIVRAYWKHSEDETINQDLLTDEGKPDERDVLANSVNVEFQLMRSDWGGAYWIAGGNLRYHSFNSGFLDAWHDQTLYGLFGQMEKTLPGSNDLTIGGRLDHHPGTGFLFSPRINLTHHFEGRRYLRLSAGEAYRDPTLIELYLDIPEVLIEVSNEMILPLTADARGNDELEPERVRSFEAAFGTPVRSSAFLRLELFRNEYEDWMNFGPVEYYSEAEMADNPMAMQLHQMGIRQPKVLSYSNIYSLKCNGAETTLRVRWNSAWRAGVGYSYVQYEAKEDIPDIIVMVPSHKIHARVTARPFPSWRASFAGRYQSEYSFDREEGGTLGEHTIADCSLQYLRNNDRFVVELSAQNIADLRYKEYPVGDAFARKIVLRVFYRY